jgi:phosphocarrier protein
LASQFACEVFIIKSGQRVNAKSIMGVMMLAAGLGTTVTIETSGSDADQAVAAVQALFNDKFGEGQ